jgi:hypothetical protein
MVKTLKCCLTTGYCSSRNLDNNHSKIPLMEVFVLLPIWRFLELVKALLIVM